MGVATERASTTQVFRRLGSVSYSSWNCLYTQLGMLGTRTNEMTVLVRTATVWVAGFASVHPNNARQRQYFATLNFMFCVSETPKKQLLP